jgi:hypothetical protein
MFRTTAPPLDVMIPTEAGNTCCHLIPLSVLELDLPAPQLGSHLAGRGVEITLDDIGRLSVSRDVARMLLNEHREAEAEQARRRAEVEQRLIEQDQLRQAQIWRGIPASHIPDGLAPAQAMFAAERESQPRRRSVVEDALAGGGAVFHPIQHVADE